MGPAKQNEALYRGRRTPNRSGAFWSVFRLTPSPSSWTIHVFTFPKFSGNKGKQREQLAFLWGFSFLWRVLFFFCVNLLAQQNTALRCNARSGSHQWQQALSVAAMMETSPDALTLQTLLQTLSSPDQGDQWGWEGGGRFLILAEKPNVRSFAVLL